MKVVIIAVVALLLGLGAGYQLHQPSKVSLNYSDVQNALNNHALTLEK